MELNDVQSESSSEEEDSDSEHDEKQYNQQQTNAITNDLNAWLSANGLSKILNKLTENDVSSLEDLQELETEDEIREFAEEIGLNKMLKNRFVKKIKELNHKQEVEETQSASSSSEEEDSDSEHNENHHNQQEANTIANDLNAWLRANRLSQIMDVLEENEVETLEDLEELENEAEIEEFAKDIGLSNKLKNRFVQKVMKLNGIQQPNAHGMMNAAATQPKEQKNQKRHQQQAVSNLSIEQKAAIKLHEIFQSILDNEDNMDKYDLNSQKIFAELYECGSAIRMLKHAGFYLSDDEERIIWERNVKTIRLMSQSNNELQANDDCDNPISAVLNAHKVSTH